MNCAHWPAMFDVLLSTVWWSDVAVKAYRLTNVQYLCKNECFLWKVANAFRKTKYQIAKMLNILYNKTRHWFKLCKHSLRLCETVEGYRTDKWILRSKAIVVLLISLCKFQYAYSKVWSILSYLVELKAERKAAFKIVLWKCKKFSRINFSVVMGGWEIGRKRNTKLARMIVHT